MRVARCSTRPAWRLQRGEERAVAGLPLDDVLADAFLVELADTGLGNFGNNGDLAWNRPLVDVPLLDERLKEHLKPFVEQGHINKWAIPSQIAIVTEIPKTSVGKLDKKRIRVEIAQWQEAGSAFLSTL